MANQYLFLAKEVLNQSELPLTYNEIWEFAVTYGIDKKIKIEGKTPWQNLGAQLVYDEDLLAELERFNQSFGIGIIKLDLDDIDSSKIVFPAEPKMMLDWETANKLAELNNDFRRFIQDIKIDLESKRIHLSEYDKIEEDIEKYIKKISN